MIIDTYLKHVRQHKIGLHLCLFVFLIIAQRLPQVVIACIDGAAFGGGLELALACDLRVAGGNSTFGLIETSLGLIPGAGGTQRLPRKLPESLAKELIFSAKKFDGKTAFEYGLLNRFNPNKNDKNLTFEMSLQLGRDILPNGPIAVRTAKQAINKGLDANTIDDAMIVEQECYAQILPTKDRWEAMAAFKEKRKPVFTGK